jgi:hypothetical protein
MFLLLQLLNKSGREKLTHVLQGLKLVEERMFNWKRLRWTFFALAFFHVDDVNTTMLPPFAMLDALADEHSLASVVVMVPEGQNQRNLIRFRKISQCVSLLIHLFYMKYEALLINSIIILGQKAFHVYFGGGRRRQQAPLASIRVRALRLRHRTNCSTADGERPPTPSKYVRRQRRRRPARLVGRPLNSRPSQRSSRTFLCVHISNLLKSITL